MGERRTGMGSVWSGSHGSDLDGSRGLERRLATSGTGAATVGEVSASGVVEAWTA
jgi:hypothetical protein